MNHNKTRTLWSLNIFILLISIGEGMVGPAIPLWGYHIGLSYSFLGLIMTGYSIAYVLTTLIAGRLSDVFNRKRILLFGISISVVASSGYCFAGGFTSLLFFRVLEGLSRGVIWPLAEAIIADNTSVQGMGMATGRFTTFYASGVAVGNLTAGFLMQYLGLRIVFPFYPVLVILAFLAIFSGVEKSEPLAKNEQRGSYSLFSFPVTEIKRIWPICYVAFAYGGFLFSLWALLSVVANYFKVSLIGIGIIFALFWFSRLISILLGSQKAESYGRKPVLMIGLVFVMVSASLLIAAKQFILLACAAVLGGLGTGIILPLTITLVADLSSPEYRGFDMGFMELSDGLGMIVQTSISGLLGELGGIQLTYLFGLVAVILALVFCSMFLRERRTRLIEE